MVQPFIAQHLQYPGYKINYYFNYFPFLIANVGIFKLKKHLSNNQI